MASDENPLLEAHGNLADFLHRSREPRYFVLRMAEHHRHYAAGFRIEVQLLNDDGQGQVVLYLRGPHADYQSGNIFVPSAVIAAALRQMPGKGDYVDESGQSRGPF